MKILLGRHGNTFGPNDTVVVAGCSNDIPLVEKGIEQANTLADALLQGDIKPKAIYCSSLRRTKDYAQIIIQRLDLPYQSLVDTRLNEIDYGDWTGLSNHQVCTQFSEQDLQNWDEQCIWPEGGNWKGSPQETQSEVQSFASDLSKKYTEDDLVLVITSNGRLRYFLQLVDGELPKRIEDKTFKVKTGNICEIAVENESFQLIFWNEPPSILVKKK